MESGYEAVIGSGYHNGSYVENDSNGVKGKAKASTFSADAAGALESSIKCTSSGISAFESFAAGTGAGTGAGTFCSFSFEASSF